MQAEKQVPVINRLPMSVFLGAFSQPYDDGGRGRTRCVSTHTHRETQTPGHKEGGTYTHTRLGKS